MPGETHPTEHSSCDWIRIFAVHLAVKHPELSAQQVLETAINEFQHGPAHTEPEQAAACCAVAGAQRAQLYRRFIVEELPPTQGV